MEYPKFKYYRNPRLAVKFDEEPVICDCCKNPTHFYANSMYTTEDINAICPDCITSGKACEKFDGEFNTAINFGNDEAYEQLVTKTPPLSTFQEIDWPHCHNDYCTYIGTCTEEDLENEDLMAELEETFDEDGYEFEEIQDMSPDYLLLYQCEVCGKHHVKIDVD